MDKLGDLSQYTNKSDLKNSFINVYNSENNPLNYVLANYEFAFEMGIGGYVFAKKGTKKILGFGKILSDYIYDEDRDEYRSIRQVEWIKTGGRGYYWLNANPIIWDFDSIEVGESIIYTSHNDKGNKRNKYKYFQSAKPVPFKILQNHLDLKSCEPIINNQGSLFGLKEEEYEIIRAVINDYNTGAVRETAEKYTAEDATSDLFTGREEYQGIVDVLKYKKNINH